MDLATCLFDNIRLAKRSDAELVIMSFFQMVPGSSDTNKERFEVFRGATTVEHCKKIIDVLAKHLNHYPKEMDAKAAKTKKAAS